MEGSSPTLGRCIEGLWRGGGGRPPIVAQSLKCSSEVWSTRERHSVGWLMGFNFFLNFTFIGASHEGNVHAASANSGDYIRRALANLTGVKRISQSSVGIDPTHY